MANATKTVLVSRDGGTTWTRHTALATSGPKAIEKVRDRFPELKGDEDALFHVDANFTAQKMEKQMVASWELTKVDLPADVAGEVGGGADRG